jgi:hypothetical protein
MMDLLGFTSSGLSRDELGRLSREPAGAARSADRGIEHATVVVTLASTRPRSVHGEDFLLYEILPAIEQGFGYGVTGRGGVFGKGALGDDTG